MVVLTDKPSHAPAATSGRSEAVYWKRLWQVRPIRLAMVCSLFQRTNRTASNGSLLCPSARVRSCHSLFRPPCRCSQSCLTPHNRAPTAQSLAGRQKSKAIATRIRRRFGVERRPEKDPVRLQFPHDSERACPGTACCWPPRVLYLRLNEAQRGQATWCDGQPTRKRRRNARR